MRGVVGLLQKGRKVAVLATPCCSSSPLFSSPSSASSTSRLSPLSSSFAAAAATTTMLANSDTALLDLASTIAKQKRQLRSKIRKDLKAFSPSQRHQEASIMYCRYRESFFGFNTTLDDIMGDIGSEFPDNTIQNIILESPWFKSSRRLCAYISCEALREVDTSRILSEVSSNEVTDDHKHTKKKLYVPRVEDKNSHMRMLSISNIEDLVTNSMNILEPSPVDANGNQREDENLNSKVVTTRNRSGYGACYLICKVMLASDPVDMFLLPGVAFDKSGRRLGRGGGYYDLFLKKYQELATERKWKQPLLVALAYSVQIMDEDIIPVSPTDIPVDALVSPSGVIRINPTASERM